MGQAAAKQGDRVIAVDTHLVVQPSLPAPVPMPLPFDGVLESGLSPSVRIMGRAAATVGSVASNLPPHIPPGGTFAQPPHNRATVAFGSLTVRINGRPAARHGDPASTCNDPVDLPVGAVSAVGTVSFG